MRKTPLSIASALGACLQLLTPAHGQSAPAAPAPAAASPSEPSERAKREAANPMRFILEAGKIKRKGADAEPTVTVVAPRVTALAPAALVPAAVTVPAPVRRVVAEVTEPLAAVPVPAPVPAPLSILTRALESLPSAPTPLLAMAIALNRPLADGAAATAPVALLSFNALPAPPPEPPAPILQTAPRLLSQVAPEFPENLMRRVRSFNELLVQITVNRDGSVRDINIVTPGYRSLEPFVVEALAQWRYEPRDEPRTQQLRLVFNEQR